jgi:phosphoglycolate phosphatase
MGYEVVLFDSDGVLVEMPDRKRLAAAVGRTFSRFDLRRPTPEDVRALVAGNVEALASLCRRNGVDLRSFCRRAAREAVRAQREELERGLRSLYDDVGGALDALRDRGRTLGIVSNNHRRAVSLALRQFGLADRFAVVRGADFSPDGMRRMKPAPDNLTATLAHLDADPRDALYVGDSDVDVLAADDAGVDSVYVRRPHRAGADRPEPTYEIDGLDALPGLVADG